MKPTKEKVTMIYKAIEGLDEEDIRGLGLGLFIGSCERCGLSADDLSKIFDTILDDYVQPYGQKQPPQR